MFGAVIAQNAAAMGASDGYSKASNNLQEYIRRYNEIKASRDFTNIADASLGAPFYYGSYAGSQNNLQEFIRRYNEIKASREFTNIADASWGAAYYY
jgi:hypothetical protein